MRSSTVMIVAMALLGCRGSASSLTDGGPSGDGGPATTEDGGATPDAATPDAGADVLDEPLSIAIGTWVRLSPSDAGSVPNFGWEAGATYDPRTKTLVHHAGHDGIPQGFPTFTFDPSTRRWAQVFPPTSPHGACLVDGALSTDLNEAKVIRFPAAMLGHGYQWSRSERFKASWAWSYDVETNEWVNWRPDYDAPVDQPYSGLHAGTQNAATTFDARRGVIFHFGGISSGGATNNLFAYDFGLNTFTRMPATTRPGVRDDGAFAHNPVTDVLVAYGAQYVEDPDTWVYSVTAKDWQRKSLSPSPEHLKAGSYSWIPKMACEDDSPFCVLVNWNPATGLHDTWSLDTSTMTWAKLATPQSPPASLSRSRNLMYAPDLHAYLLDLQRAGNAGNELWAFRRRERPEVVLRPPSRLLIEVSAESATLRWPRAVGAFKYRVLRSLTRSGLSVSWSTLAETEATTFIDPKPATATDGAMYQVLSIGADGSDTAWGPLARAVPHPIVGPVVSALTVNKVEVKWSKPAAEDVAGYNLYRWKASISAVSVGTPAPYKDNDPDYGRLTPTGVKTFIDPVKLNTALLTHTTFTDETVNLTGPTPESAGAAFAVFGYEVRAVNRWGVEGGRGGRSLTIPAEPRNVMIQEGGSNATLKWDTARESNVRGFKLYTLGGGVFTIVPVPGAELLTQPTFSIAAGQGQRFWVVTIDALGQEGQPSSSAVFASIYRGFFTGPWHQ